MFFLLILAGILSFHDGAFSAEKAKPLTFDVVVDKEVDERFFGRENFLNLLDEIFKAASSVFEREIGRSFEINNIRFVEPPPETREKIFVLIDKTKIWIQFALIDKTEIWIQKEFYDTRSDKIFFITPNRFTYKSSPKLINGSAPDEKLLLVHFPLFENDQSLITLLHELGHTCGATHDNDNGTNQIMHNMTTLYLSFDDANRAIIKRNCGPGK